jgi:hypothetical protein
MKRAFRIMTAVLAAHLTTPAQAQPADRIDINLSGDGWKLWLDRAAPWQHDELLCNFISYHPTPP